MLKSKLAFAPHTFETFHKASNGSHRRRRGESIEATGPQGPLRIEILPPSRLRASERNARTHSKNQIQQIAQSIARFGFINPIIIDDHRRIIAGHGRSEAARLLGLTQVPVLRVSHLTETELRAYTLADNKITQNAGWDRGLLAVELQELQISLPEIGLDIGITGFEACEIDSIMSDLGEQQPNPTDDIADATDEPLVARKGDLFVLGVHRLLVGDTRDEAAHAHLMQSETADMAFLDPPYNVKVAGHVGGRGRIKHPEFACASGEMTSDQYVRFLHETLSLCARHTSNGAISYVCMDWRHARELLEAGSSVYDELKNICVWAKTTPGQGSFYRSQHELIFVYKRGKAPHLNTFELGQHGRTRTNVWVYPGASSFRAGRLDELKMHPTVKPVALIADAMRDCSRRGSIVLDAFAGSGSTIMAAEQIGRRAFCIEIDARYADIAIRRWQRFTKKDAVLEATGETFDEIATKNRKQRVEQVQSKRPTRGRA
jgi:DNA modification methylase